MAAPLLVQLRDLVAEFGPGLVAQTLPIAIWEAADGRPDPLTRELHHALDSLVSRWARRMDPMPHPVLCPDAHMEWCERQFGLDCREEARRG